MVKLEDILKPGAKLTARKLTKKHLKKYRKLFIQAEKERKARSKVDWEAMNKPMTI